MSDLTAGDHTASASDPSLAELTLGLQQLSAQRQSHVERLRALGEVSSGMAHDLNNVLAHIVGNVELLLQHVDLDEEVRAGLERISQAALDGAKMVQRVQDFVRLREGSETEPVDLHAVARDVVDLLRPRWRDEAQARGIRVRVRLSAASCPAVHGNAAELREALANLLNNAFDAMPRGGSVVIWTGVVQGHAAIRVRDTGTGMTEEVRQRALEPFFTTKAERGTGLGLATANSIVRRHEGHLGIDSSLGSGTTITILLPVRESSEPEPRRPTTPPSQPLRVLVVDDDERLAKILCRFLRADGHQVTVAGCGPAGLAMLEELARAGERVDVVFTDWSMEGVHGRDLARRARTLFPQARVVLVTGWGEGVEEGLEAEVNGVLSKPFGLETVRRVLGGG